MEFSYNNEQYKVEIGVHSKKWILLVRRDVGWKFLQHFSLSIHDEDIIDHAKNWLKNE